MLFKRFETLGYTDPNFFKRDWPFLGKRIG